MSKQQTIIHNIGVSHPLLEVNPAFARAVSAAMRKKSFGRDERIISHGDDAEYLWLVCKGWVKLSRQTPDGKETIIGLCTEGDVFGEAALFTGASYPYTAEIVGGEAELVYIPSSAVRAVVANDATISSRIMEMLSERTSQVQLKLEHMSTMSAAQRLGCFLLRLCHNQTDGSKILHIPVEKNVLAAYLGMKPETLSRSLQQLKPLGISINGAEMHIEKINSLQEFVCGSCSESGSCEVEDQID